MFFQVFLQVLNNDLLHIFFANIIKNLYSILKLFTIKLTFLINSIGTLRIYFSSNILDNFKRHIKSYHSQISLNKRNLPNYFLTLLNLLQRINNISLKKKKK